jgi:hypothetical protein
MLFIFLFLYIDLLFLDSLHNHISYLDVSFLANSIIAFDNKKLNPWYITGGVAAQHSDRIVHFGFV